MTSRNAAETARPVVAWENEGGALAPTPETHPVPIAPWEAIATLGAVIAVWPDLSAAIRRRIASDAVLAMSRAEAHDGPRA